MTAHTKPVRALSNNEVWDRFNAATRTAARKHLPHNPEAYELERARLEDEAHAECDAIADRTDDGRDNEPEND